MRHDLISNTVDFVQEILESWEIRNYCKNVKTWLRHGLVLNLPYKNEF